MVNWVNSTGLAEERLSLVETSLIRGAAEIFEYIKQAVVKVFSPCVAKARMKIGRRTNQDEGQSPMAILGSRE